MTSKNRKKKLFSFRKEDEKFISKWLDERDKVKFNVGGDYVAHCIRLFIANLKVKIELTPEQIKQICSRNLLSIISGVPTCNQGVYPFGLQRSFHFIYKKEHPRAGEIMDYEDIKEYCDDCIQGFTEDPRIEEIRKLVTRDEITTYSCTHPDSSTTDQTTFKESKFACPKTGKVVRIDRTCLKDKCGDLFVGILKLSPIDIDEDKDADKDEE